MKNKFLSRLMAMSWEIQRTQKRSRSKSLIAAWSIAQNANVAIYYLVEKHSKKHSKAQHQTKPENLILSLYA